MDVYGESSDTRLIGWPEDCQQLSTDHCTLFCLDVGGRRFLGLMNPDIRFLYVPNTIVITNVK